MLRSLFFPILLGVSVLGGEGAKILALFPMPAHSHFTLGFRLAEELASRGHEVTAINPYPQKSPIKNYRDISVEDNVAFVEELKKRLFSMNSMNPLHILTFVFSLGYQITDRTFSHKNVQELLNSREQFDVMIMEHFVNDAQVGIAHHFNIPVILIGSSPPSAFNNHIFANPAPSSYVPNIFGTFTEHMNFWERVQNFLHNILYDAMIEFYHLPGQREIFKKYVKTDLQLDDVLHNVSLMLTNSHVTVNDAVPRVPNMIEIGGYHINPPKKLPEEIQKFLDESKEGVILFSMGSNLKSKDLRRKVRDDIMKAFSKLKQTVLWKFEADLPNTPTNVKIMKWLPQQDVLAHPNVKVFISHGGLLSLMETVYFGVPIIGIPVFADQKTNVANAVANGYAVAVPLSELSEEKLSWALNEVLNNHKYSENAKQRSKVMLDQPLKPIDAAVYWVEHVIRHKGAPHFRSAAVDLKWYQRHMIDVIIFLTLITIILFILFYIIIKRILGLCFARKPKILRSKKNK